mgnify:CR=1 FL=1
MSLFTNSRFLKKEDVGTGIVATISHVVEEDIGRDEAPEKGNVLYFHEANIKPIVLKPTNANLIAEITNVWDEPTIMAGGWNGFQILLVNDMSVTFNGKRGGLRARPVPQAAPVIPQAPQPVQRHPVTHAPMPQQGLGVGGMVPNLAPQRPQAAPQRPAGGPPRPQSPQGQPQRPQPRPAPPAPHDPYLPPADPSMDFDPGDNAGGPI